MEIKITEDVFLERFSHSKHKDNIKIIGKYNGYGNRIECQCTIDGYIWNPFAYNIACGSGCPVCANDVVMIGVNDFCTTHPDVAKLLENFKDGQKVTYGTAKKLKFICPDCGKPKNDTPKNVRDFGVRCTNCNDHVSFPNKVLYNLLWQIETDFFSEKSFDYSVNQNGNKAFYDFYIPSKNIIIEVHGAQHYVRQIHENARTVQEEQENDLYKMNLALNNGVEKDKYITIDACCADFDYIKNNTIASNLSKYYDLSTVDWDKVFNDSLHSIVLKASELWNEGYKTCEIATMLHKNVSCIISLLKQGNKIGKCNYTPELSNKLRDESRMKTILCIEDMSTYFGARECGDNIGKSRDSMIRYLSHNSSHCVNGKHYFYLDEFIQSSVNEIAKFFLKPNHGGNSGCVTPIFCIEADKIFNTKKDAFNWCGVDKKTLLKHMRNEVEFAGFHPVTNEELHWRDATIEDVIRIYSLEEKQNKLKELKYA